MPSQTPVSMTLPSCPVCCNEYALSIRYPVSLGCGHILCHLCLKEIPDQLCPLDQIRINFALMRFVEICDLNLQSDSNSDSLSSSISESLNYLNINNNNYTDDNNNPKTISMDKKSKNNNQNKHKKVNLKKIKKNSFKNQHQNNTNKAITTSTTTNKNNEENTKTIDMSNDENDNKGVVDNNNNNNHGDDENNENLAQTEILHKKLPESVDDKSNEINLTTPTSSTSLRTKTPTLMRSLSYEEKENYKKVVETIEKLSLNVKAHLTLLDNSNNHNNVNNHNNNNNHHNERSILSRPMQRKLLAIINCQLMEEGGRMRGLRAARSLGERCVTELLLQHQNSQQLSSNLWAAVRARGCQFLGPSMQEDVLKLILTLLSDGTTLSRKVLVVHVVQELSKNYPQASKTSIGHVVQLLYRASCFKVAKRESESSLMQLKDEFRSYKTLRREHDAQIVQIAIEAGLRILPEQWSILLYADANHKAHMQSICGKLQAPLTFSQALVEFNMALARHNNNNNDSFNLDILKPHLRYLAGIDPARIENPTWLQLFKSLDAAHQLTVGLMEFLIEYANIKKNNMNNSNQHNNNTVVDCVGSGGVVGTTPTNKYKVCLCRDLITRGSCPRGNNCTFAHSDNELEHYRAMQRKLIDNIAASTTISTQSAATTAVAAVTTTTTNNVCQQLLTSTKSTVTASGGNLSPNTKTLSPYKSHAQCKPTNTHFENNSNSGNSSMETSPQRTRNFHQQQQQQQHHFQPKNHHLHNYQQWSLMPPAAPPTLPLSPQQQPHQQHSPIASYNQINMQQQMHQMNMQHHQQQQRCLPNQVNLMSTHRPAIANFEQIIMPDDPLQTTSLYKDFSRRRPPAPQPHMQHQQHVNLLPTQGAYTAQQTSANWWNELQSKNNKPQTAIMPHMLDNYNRKIMNTQQQQQSNSHYRNFGAPMTVATTTANTKTMTSYANAKSNNNWSDILTNNIDTEYNALCEGVLASGLGVYGGFNKFNDLLSAGLLMPPGDRNQFVNDITQQQSEISKTNFDNKNKRQQQNVFVNETVTASASASHHNARASPLAALFSEKAFQEQDSNAKNNCNSGLFVRSDSILDDDVETTTTMPATTPTTTVTATALENVSNVVNKYGPICPMYKSSNNNNNTATPLLSGSPAPLLLSSPSKMSSLSSSTAVATTTASTSKFCTYSQNFAFNLDFGINVAPSISSPNNSFIKPYDELNLNVAELKDLHLNTDTIATTTTTTTTTAATTTTSNNKVIPAILKNNSNNKVTINSNNKNEAKAGPYQALISNTTTNKLDIFDANTNEFNKQANMTRPYLWKDPRSVNIKNAIITLPVPNDVANNINKPQATNPISTVSKSNPMKRRYQPPPPQQQQQQQKTVTSHHSASASRMQKPMNYRYYNHHNQLSQQKQSQSQSQLQQNVTNNGNMFNMQRKNNSISSNANKFNFNINNSNNNTNSNNGIGNNLNYNNSNDLTNIGFNLFPVEKEMASKPWPFTDV